MIASEGSRHWFIDGTCRFVPLGFYQFLVLMIYISSMYVSGHSYFFRLRTKRPVEHIPFYPQAL
jgi:hypothetical protein